MAQKLKFGNGTWATKEGSTLAYNDENNNYKPLPFTTTRDSIATRVNKEGLIEVVGNDIPRIDYTDSAEGVLLLENTATNLITYSEDFSQSSWVKLGAGTGTTAIVTSDYAVSPDGTQNASRLQCDLNSGGSSSSNQSLIYNSYSSSGNQTISIYAKSNNGQNQTIYFANTQTSGDTITVTPQWQRFTFSHSTSTYVSAIGLRGRSGGAINDTADILIWGSQAEQGSYDTSYIPTSGSTVQRAAETANESGNSEVFNDSEGVLFADIAALTEIDTFRAISISSGSDNNRINIWYWNNGTFKIDSNSGANVQSNFDFDANMTLFNKIAFKYKQNDFCVFHNGFKIGIDTSGITPVGLSELSFDRANGAYPFYGKTKEIGYYDTVLTDAELETLTSYRSLSELVTELNLNTL